MDTKDAILKDILDWAGVQKIQKMDTLILHFFLIQSILFNVKIFSNVL